MVAYGFLLRHLRPSVHDGALAVPEQTKVAAPTFKRVDELEINELSAQFEALDCGPVVKARVGELAIAKITASMATLSLGHDAHAHAAPAAFIAAPALAPTASPVATSPSLALKSDWTRDAERAGTNVPIIVITPPPTFSFPFMPAADGILPEPSGLGAVWDHVKWYNAAKRRVADQVAREFEPAAARAVIVATDAGPTALDPLDDDHDLEASVYPSELRASPFNVAAIRNDGPLGWAEIDGETVYDRADRERAFFGVAEQLEDCLAPALAVLFTPSPASAAASVATTDGADDDSFVAVSGALTSAYVVDTPAAPPVDPALGSLSRIDGPTLDIELQLAIAADAAAVSCNDAARSAAATSSPATAPLSWLSASPSSSLSISSSSSVVGGNSSTAPSSPVSDKRVTLTCEPPPSSSTASSTASRRSDSTTAVLGLIREFMARYPHLDADATRRCRRQLHLALVAGHAGLAPGEAYVIAEIGHAAILAGDLAGLAPAFA